MVVPLVTSVVRSDSAELGQAKLGRLGKAEFIIHMFS